MAGLACVGVLASGSATAGTVDYVYVDGFEAGVDCTAELVCPAPPPSDKSCISGRISDAGSGKDLRAFFDADAVCGGGAIGGACDLVVEAFDALEWIGNPSTAAPLASDDLTTDGCGRFRFSGITPPPLGFIVIVTEDRDGSEDRRATTGAVHELGTNQNVGDAAVLATRHHTDTQWTQSAGSPFGADTFVDVGVLLLSYVAADIPGQGVTVTVNGSSVAANDFYFSDQSTTERQLVGSGLASTGVNGSALFVEGALTSYSGVGGEPVGCTWPSELAASVAGFVIFAELRC